jgi:ATP-dependent exoDNAse (exonuclease V) beta subunit
MSFSIYKASAGAGKTYRITGEYLKIILSEIKNYRTILAVTFTNKAAGEMKSRIVEELNKLASGNNSNYIDELTEHLNVNKDQLKDRASKVLRHLIHDYGRFNVKTIDSFFQEILKSFTRETGLSFGFEIELNNTIVLEQAVDILIKEVDTNKELSGWLSEFAISRIKDGKNWDMRQELISLGKQLFVESFQTNNEIFDTQFSDKKLIDEYLNDINGITDKFENKMDEYTDSVFNTLKASGIPVKDFKYGDKGFISFFNRAKKRAYDNPSKRVLSYIDKPDTVGKTNAATDIFTEQILPILKSAIEYQENNLAMYNSANVIKKNTYSLGVLSDIRKKIKEIESDKNIFLISDVGIFISRIIENSDIPFIYEKAGNILKYYIIDEFQDTSTVQWSNFRPLIENSIGDGNKNIIVGDVKQSIYRWRNGDWRILGERAEQDFGDEIVNLHNLEYNWRSKKNIIDFNNFFFSKATTILQTDFNSFMIDSSEDLSEYSHKLKNMYSHSYQKTGGKDNTGGKIELKGYNKDITKTDRVIDTVDKVKELLKLYNPEDIAVLVRTKSEGKLIADALIKESQSADKDNKFNVISNESLFLTNSTLIRFIIGLMRKYTLPEDLPNEQDIVVNYNILKNSDLNQDQLFLDSTNQIENIEEVIFDKNKPNGSTLPTEMVRTVLSKIDISTKDRVYLHTFTDILNSFCTRNTPTLSAFIEWWDTRGYDKSIQLPEETSAVRVMTIHKSKGLEYKAILIPFADWRFEPNASMKNILWCKSDTEPFNKLSLVPIQYSKSLLNSIFSKDYIEERFNSMADAYNMLYVAFTRAKDYLYVGYEESTDKIQTVGNLISFFVNAQESFPHIDDNEYSDIFSIADNEESVFSFGDVKSEKSDSIENDVQNNHKLKIKSIASEYTLNNMDLFKSDKATQGELMHNILSDISEEADLERAVNKYSTTIEQLKLSHNDIKTTLMNAIESVKSYGWFNSTNTVLNERDILAGIDKLKRPDRIILNGDNAEVIDYKFGDKESDDYKDQVNEYCKLLKKCGIEETKGYIWYIAINKVVEC